MQRVEWSRSRYWLCHFLHNRHERPRIDWCDERRLAAPLQATVPPWVQRQQEHLAADRAWMTLAATGTDSHGETDHALVQSLRLMVKEQQYLAKLHQQAIDRYDLAQPPRGHRLMRAWAAVTQPVRRWLGLRFELSILLLMSLIHLTLARLLVSPEAQTAGMTDAGILGVCQQSLRDRQLHAAFLAERLTREFADFNFIRRNLRRWRLRGMFALLLGWVILTQGRMIRAAGSSRSALTRQAWRSFEGVLERMVPYHRANLLATLLAQEQQPYDASRVSL